MDTPPRLAWKVPAVAEALGGVPAKQVYALIRDGSLAHIRVGKHYLVPDEELRRYIADNTSVA